MGKEKKIDIIFKSKKDSTFIKELNNYSELNKSNIIVRTQHNAWIDEELFINYIKEVLCKYEHNKRKLLIMDYCPANNTPEVLNLLKKKQIDLVFIPKRMTSVLQPLDRMINLPFKKYLKNKFTDYMLFEKKDKENISDSRKRILKDINDVWNNNVINNEYINKDKIFKFFKITWISNNFDGSEDDYFDGYNVINDLIDEQEKNFMIILILNVILVIIQIKKNIILIIKIQCY